MGTVEEKKKKHLRAIKTTLIAGMIALIPLTFLYHVSTNYSGSEFYRDIESPPFLMNDIKGNFFTNQSLIGGVTLFVYMPKDCGACSDFLEEVTKVYNWSQEALKKLEHFEESDVKLNRVVVSSSEAVQSLLGTWTVISESESATTDTKIIGEVCQVDTTSPFSAIFDRYGKIKACIGSKNFQLDSVKRLLSKITFNTSMDEYLSERTFFGPKKKHAEDIESGESR